MSFSEYGAAEQWDGKPKKDYLELRNLYMSPSQSTEQSVDAAVMKRAKEE